MKAGVGRIEQAAAEGKADEILAGLRERITAAVYDDATLGRDLTALAKQLHELLGGDVVELRRLRARLARAVDSPGMSTRDLAAAALRIRLLTDDITVIEEATVGGDEVSAAADLEDEPWDGSL